MIRQEPTAPPTDGPQLHLHNFAHSSTNHLVWEDVCWLGKARREEKGIFERSSIQFSLVDSKSLSLSLL